MQACREGPEGVGDDSVVKALLVAEVVEKRRPLQPYRRSDVLEAGSDIPAPGELVFCRGEDGGPGELSFGSGGENASSL
jgi:hypothetical protein